MEQEVVYIAIKMQREEREESGKSGERERVAKRRVVAEKEEETDERKG